MELPTGYGVSSVKATAPLLPGRDRHVLYGRGVLPEIPLLDDHGLHAVIGRVVVPPRSPHPPPLSFPPRHATRRCAESFGPLAAPKTLQAAISRSSTPRGARVKRRYTVKGFFACLALALPRDADLSGIKDYMLVSILKNLRLESSEIVAIYLRYCV